MKVALVYDRVNKWGGAERVMLALHELFPQAPLFTSVYDKKKAPWAKIFQVKTSPLQYFPLSRSHHEFIPFLMPLAFEQFTFDEYDLVISLTSEAAKGILTKPHTKHICYCLTPTRYLWSGYEEYFNTKLKKVFAHPFVSYLRAWDKIAAYRPDMYVAASSEIKQRIKNYYKQDVVTVIYPPSDLVSLNTKNLSRPLSSKKTKRAENYFLVVSRFVPYKRIDIAIQACNILRLPLKIIGSGVDEKKLKALAGPSIEFLGNLTDKQLVEYYKNCSALLFPGVEDFGLTVIEAQYFGKPVIAFAGGGALETIIAGKTGCFFKQQTVESLVTVLRTFDESKYTPNDCRRQAENFTSESFQSKFRDLVDQLI